MKKIILISFLLHVGSTFAQIKLNDNSVHPGAINSEKINNIIGYGKYNATILGYAESCGFEKSQQRIIFNNFFNHVDNLKLSDSQIKIINDNFIETAKLAKEKGVANSNTTCDKFKIEFNKIVQTIK